MEGLLSGGYSSVHTRLGFDTEIFTSKSKEYIEQKNNIVEKMRNVCGEPDEKKQKKKLNKELYNLLKKEALKSSNKPIYKIRLDGEQESKGRRVFSKIFKLVENNQYRFAMTNPLPIGTFKREKEANIEILNEAIENFDPNAKVGKIFVVDIEFDVYDDPRKSFYNEIYPCIL